MREYAADDVDWRSGRAAVYVFHAGEDVLRVGRAYALFQSENALGPLAFRACGAWRTRWSAWPRPLHARRAPAAT